MATDQAVEDDKDQQGWQDYKPSGDGWSDYTPPQGDISSEASMAAHPPIPKLATNPSRVAGTQTGLAPQMRPQSTTSSRFINTFTDTNKSLPRTPGSDEEAVREGSIPAVEGMTAIGTAGVPAEAIATQSWRPFLPLLRGAAGSIAGGVVGREAGHVAAPIFGPKAPEIGGDVGGLAGGFLGVSGERIPTKEDVLSLFKTPEERANEEFLERGKDMMAAVRQQPSAFGFSKKGGLHVATPEELAAPTAKAAKSVVAPPTDVPRGTIPDVSVVPEPRSLFEGEKPGYNQSTPRRLLLGNANAGRPGAADAMRNAGGTVIYAPKGVGIEPTAERLARLQSTVAAPGELHGNPTPFGSANDFVNSLGRETPDVELVGSPSGPRGNASGAPGGGGLEEQGRMNSENQQGVKYVRENPGGGRSEITGLGRQDAKAYRPGERVIRINGDGSETVLDEKPRIQQGSVASRKIRGNRQE